MAEVKDVWVLGAGFSASLGGPLLDDLFSERSEIELQAKYGMSLDRRDCMARAVAVEFWSIRFYRG